MVLLLCAAWRPESAAHQRRVGVASMGVAAGDAGGASSGLSFRAGAPRRASIAVDDFRWAADCVFLLATIIAIAPVASTYNAREGITTAESHVLVLFATFGHDALAAARDLMIALPRHRD